MLPDFETKLTEVKIASSAAGKIKKSDSFTKKSCPKTEKATIQQPKAEKQLTFCRELQCPSAPALPSTSVGLSRQ